MRAQFQNEARHATAWMQPRSPPGDENDIANTKYRSGPAAAKAYIARRVSNVLQPKGRALPINTLNLYTKETSGISKRSWKQKQTLQISSCFYSCWPRKTRNFAGRAVLSRRKVSPDDLGDNSLRSDRAMQTKAAGMLALNLSPPLIIRPGRHLSKGNCRPAGVVEFFGNRVHVAPNSRPFLALPEDRIAVYFVAGLCICFSGNAADWPDHLRD
ncbi:hypothetical protein [Mesorhizobium qingshengii]|uniref:Uncharacterized protein n=1 Tax=Mesorhizobium qingshengii TaxID=1165689 RepID=A0A1G5ZTC8_9HYPH|nr:hypothetical protein [Mesorhizobium qingshengii]SDA97827.1 hypothetical protein SAMN02927914_05988 [Mesorhizobium qingshengii]